jgi:phosphatidylinositol alpha-1,6-mannosyltransferase
MAAQTFLGLRGGISRLCDLSARAAVDSGLPVELLSVQNEGGHFQKARFWRGYHGSRPLFVLGCVTAALKGHHLFYDQLGTARTHTLVSRIAEQSGSWIHGIEVWEQLRSDRLRAAQQLNLIVANTNYTRERAARQHKIFETAKVCWLATWEDELPSNPAPLNGPPVVLILGRLDQAAYKGHRELIESWPTVIKAVPDAKLVIAGTGPRLETYRSMAAASNVASRIEIKGLIPESEMNQMWQRTVVFAMPSRGDGFGLAYIEAMRWGIPVIASIHDAGCEVNVDRETGFNVNLDHPRDLAESLITILRDRDLAAKFGSAGQHRWQQYFRYTAFRERFSKILRHLVML